MDIKSSIKGIVFKICIIFLSLSTLIWFSIFSYGILYYLYIPAVAHVKPVHLRYDMSCYMDEPCKHPFDNISLIERGEYEFLRAGQGYAIEVVLEMPESERNYNQGMFMIKLDMLDYNGSVIQASHRPALLRYRSYLFKMMYTVFCMPGLLAGSLEEKQTLTIPLFEKYIEDSYRPAHFAHIEVQAKYAEVYSSTLRIHAQFTGLRYLMYYWPVTSAVVGIGSNFLFLLTTTILIWLRETMKSETEDDQQDTHQSHSVKKEVKKQPKRRQFQRASAGPSRDKTPEKKTESTSRIKKDEIENLQRYTTSHSRQHVEEIHAQKHKKDESGEQFFDAETPSTSKVATGSTGEQDSYLRQRIHQILNEKVFS